VQADENADKPVSSTDDAKPLTEDPAASSSLHTENIDTSPSSTDDSATDANQQKEKPKSQDTLDQVS
jgi:hypothetical protein